MNQINNKGVGNIAYSINIIKDCQKETMYKSIEELLENIAERFEEEDKKINELLPNQVLINKTKAQERYRTEKIIRSLLNLGIPLVPTYEIAHATIEKICDYLKAESNEEKHLSTKDVRNMVSLAIQECSTTKYSMSDIESWTNKYARRYGHNNHNVEIYWDKSEKTKAISYEYIEHEFLDDVINEITHGEGLENEISAACRRDMATEILDFINHCDLYRIRYSLLKDMIIEIATQPPHPWMIYDLIRNDILKYDYDALSKNISIINKIFESGYETAIPQSAELEILHHASALVLEMHNYFLGCYDLTAFYLLKEVFKTLQDANSWNDTITRSKISGLLADVSFSGVEIRKLIELIDRLATGLNKKRLGSAQFAQDVKQFGDYALRIYELGNIRRIEEVLNSDWSQSGPEDVLIVVKPLLYSIFPCRRYKLTYEKNYFWINYSFVKLPSFESGDFKPSFFVIYADKVDEDITFLDLLNEGRTKKNCNTILLITNDINISVSLKKRINEYLEITCLIKHYQLICFTRADLLELFKNKDKVFWFDNFLQSEVELPI